MRLHGKKEAKSLLRRMATRRLKQSRETVPLALGMFFSILIMTFFLFFTVTVKEEVTALASGLPHVAFLRRVADGMSMAAGLLALATLLNLRVWAKLGNEASAGTVAVLNSLGAKPSQRWYVLWVELLYQYGVSLLAGVTAGSIGGIAVAYSFLGKAADVAEKIPTYTILWSVILALSCGMVMLCYAAPQMTPKRRSPTAVEGLRRKGREVSAQPHGYRASNTFKRQSVLKRLAAKSIDFYKTRYRGLAISLAVSVFYPILAALLIRHLLSATVVLDTNPFDGVDTSAAVEASVRMLLSMTAVGFLLLTAQGVWSGILLARAQAEQRKQTGHAYVAMGMSERDFRRVVSLEWRSLLLRSGIYLLLLFLLGNFSFSFIT